MRRRAVPLLLLLAATPAGAEEPFAEVMRGLAAVRTRRATFVEEKSLPELDRPLSSSGLLLWQAPDRLEKRTLEPEPERFVIDGATVTLERPGRGLRETIDLDAAPEIRPLVEALRGTLAGDAATLALHHDIRFSGDPSRWRIVLVPRNPRARAAVQRIVLEGEGAFLRVVETQGNEGNTRLVASPAP